MQYNIIPNKPSLNISIYTNENKLITLEKLDLQLYNNPNVTCVFFIGDCRSDDIDQIYKLSKHIKRRYPLLEIGWWIFSKEMLFNLLNKNSNFLEFFDYIINKYDKKIYEVLHEYANTGNLESKHRLSDITYKFWNDKN